MNIWRTLFDPLQQPWEQTCKRRMPAATSANSSLTPGITNDSPQVPTLGPTGSFHPHLSSANFVPLQGSGGCISRTYIYYQKSHFWRENKINFEHMLHWEGVWRRDSSLFPLPRGLSSTCGKTLRGICELGNRDLPLDALAGKHDMQR